MYAMELSGVHVGRLVSIDYRFTTFKKDEPNANVTGKLGKVTHKPGGEVYIYGDPKFRDLKWSRGRTNYRIPYNAEVTFLDDNSE